MHHTKRTKLLQLNTQLLKLLLTDDKDTVGKHFELATIDSLSLCITVSFIRTNAIHFTIYVKNDQKYKIRSQSFKTSSKTFNEVGSLIEQFLTINDIAALDNFCLKRVPAPKSPQKRLTSFSDTTEKRYKRGVKRPKRNLHKTVNTQSTSHLVEPTTPKQIREASLERKMFSDPKMWKYKQP